MALPNPQFIANVLVESGNNPDLLKLDSVLQSLLLQKFSTISSIEEISDYVEKYKGVIADELFIKINENSNDGITSNFEITQDSNDYYIKFLDRPEIILLRKIQADTPENFELLCKIILEKMEGKATVTGGKDDRGIDFISSDLKLNNLPYLSTKGSRVFVLGQAKRYKDGNHVTEKEIKEFIGSCIVKIDTLKKTRSEQYGIFQPTILSFWITSDFHDGARDLARELGIWYLNGIALAQLVINLNIQFPLP